MERRLLILFLSALILFDVTATFPLFRGLREEYEPQPEAELKKSSGVIMAETRLKTKTDFSRNALDLSSEIPRHREHGRGSSLHARLASRDESKAQRKKRSKFIALSIFGGCVAFMSLSFAIMCCVQRVKAAANRVKEATHVDVRPRQEADLPGQVSKIDDDAVHIDVGQY